ncbi:MAG: ParA family protein, partial [Gallintestinimicrobium sp.]|uniref:ParA family protein n=1 Tax=Gallintestinimicrobium sp. TaxID=2981655 RepID=UPI003993C589
MDTQIISLSNQKGGVGKTTTCANLGIGLAREGKRVLLVDCDPQASLTLSLGWRKPETLSVTLATLMGRVLQEQPVHAEEAILHHAEGVDLIPGSIALSGVEASLDTRQNVLKRVLDDCRKDYSHVLLDCMPSLGMMTINALAAADSVLIPTIPHYLSVDGLGRLMESIGRMRRGLNRGLRVEGILITMASRTTYA